MALVHKAGSELEQVADAGRLQRPADGDGPLAMSRAGLQQLQAAAGNAAVQRLLAVQRAGKPFIKRVTVHLAPPQAAELEWTGTPPEDAPGLDSFTVSTGKGYSDPWDAPRTCTRDCCKDPLKQCAPPYNRPDRVGSCCTFIGNTFTTGVTKNEHNGYKHWTPIQPHYSARGIALHSHPTVTGQPIGHGCVRMDEPNAERIHLFAKPWRTNVTIEGRAAPVACESQDQCDEKGKRKPEPPPHPDIEPFPIGNGAEGEAER